MSYFYLSLRLYSNRELNMLSCEHVLSKIPIEEKWQHEETFYIQCYLSQYNVQVAINVHLSVFLCKRFSPSRNDFLSRRQYVVYLFTYLRTCLGHYPPVTIYNPCVVQWTVGFLRVFGRPYSNRIPWVIFPSLW